MNPDYPNCINVQLVGGPCDGESIWFPMDASAHTRTLEGVRHWYFPNDESEVSLKLHYAPGHHI